MTARHYGLLPTTPDHRDYRFAAPRQYSGEFVDLSSGIVSVKDQLNLGACVPHGVTEAVEFVLRKQGSPVFATSRLFIYWNGRVLGKYPLNQDTGLQIRDGINSAVQFGAPPETDWPYDPAKFAQRPPAQEFTEGLQHQAVKYAQVDPGQLDDAIASGHPVVSGFDVRSSFESDEVANTGIVPMPKPSEQLLGGHCTIYVSTAKDGAEIGGVKGVKYRKKLNSWGAGWGLGGYYWEPVPFAEEYESDFWVITSMEDPAVVPPVPPSGNPDGDFAAVLHPWVNTRHTSVGGGAKVAAAAKSWLQAKAL